MQEIVWIEHATAGALAKMPHAFATLVGWVQIVRGAMKLCISVFLIAQDTESSTLTLANANAIPNGLEGIATSVSSPFTTLSIHHKAAGF